MSSNPTNDTANGKGAGRRTVATSGQERISDKELAQWVKQVEDNIPPKEKGSSKPRPLGEMPKPNGQTDKPSDPTPSKG
jgi:predicted RNA-binding protein with PIN domain